MGKLIDFFGAGFRNKAVLPVVRTEAQAFAELVNEMAFLPAEIRHFFFAVRSGNPIAVKDAWLDVRTTFGDDFATDGRRVWLADVAEWMSSLASVQVATEEGEVGVARLERGELTAREVAGFKARTEATRVRSARVTQDWAALLVRSQEPGIFPGMFEDPRQMLGL